MGTDVREILVPYTGGAQAHTEATTATAIKQVFAFEVTTTQADTDANVSTATVHALPVFDMGMGAGGGVSNPVIRSATVSTNLWVQTAAPAAASDSAAGAQIWMDSRFTTQYSDSNGTISQIGIAHQAVDRTGHLFVSRTAWNNSFQPALAAWMDSRLTTDQGGAHSTVLKVSDVGPGSITAQVATVTIASPTTAAIVSATTNTGAGEELTSVTTEAVLAMGPHSTIVEGGETFHAQMGLVTVSKIPTNEGVANLWISPDMPPTTRPRMGIHFDPEFTGVSGADNIIKVSDVVMGAAGGTAVALLSQNTTNRMYVAAASPDAADLGAKVHASQVGAWTVGVTNTLAAGFMTNTDSESAWIQSFPPDLDPDQANEALGNSAAGLAVWNYHGTYTENTVAPAPLFAYCHQDVPAAEAVARLAVWCRQDVQSDWTVNVAGSTINVLQDGNTNWQVGITRLNTNQNGAGLWISKSPQASSDVAAAMWMDARLTSESAPGTTVLMVSDVNMAAGGGGTDIAHVTTGTGAIGSHWFVNTNPFNTYSDTDGTTYTMAAGGIWQDSRMTETVSGGAVAASAALKVYPHVSRLASHTIHSAQAFSDAGAGDVTFTTEGATINCQHAAWYNCNVEITGAGTPGPIFFIPQVKQSDSWFDYDFGFWKQLGFAQADAKAGILKSWKVPALGDTCRVFASGEAVNSIDMYTITMIVQPQNVC